MYLEITAKSPAAWKTLLPKLQFYAEEADLRLDTATTLGENLLKPDGVWLKCPESAAVRLKDILQKAGLLAKVHLDVELILPQDDPAEAKIQEKLYPGGDTSKKPAELKDRALPSDDLRYSMSAEQYSEYMRGLGVRAKT